MKENRHWVLKRSFLRSFQFPSVWKSKHSMPVSGPTAAIPVETDVERWISKQWLSWMMLVGIEVGVDLVDAWPGYTI